MTFAQRRNRLTTHFSERIPVDKRRMTVLAIGRTHVPYSLPLPSIWTRSRRGILHKHISPERWDFLVSQQWFSFAFAVSDNFSPFGGTFWFPRAKEFP